MENKQNNYIYLARIVLEAKTPIAIGSGETDLTTDSVVATDVNGLPYIPGTSIAGVLKHLIGDETAKQFFGYQSGKEGMGSKVVFTEGKMIGKDHKVIDGLADINWNDEFYSFYRNLPIRQHVRINSNGVAEKGQKFDEQIVYKGTRFCFEVEFIADNKDELNNFELILKYIKSSGFRIGSGTRSGFGVVEPIELLHKTNDINDSEQLEGYLNKSSSLSDEKFWAGASEFDKSISNNDWVKYELKIEPEDFFLFSSGFGSDVADIKPVTETILEWNDKNSPEFKEQKVLIPGSSIKGAVSHRLAFYYNKAKEYFIGNENAKVGNENLAVQTLFGSEGEVDIETNKMINQKRGNVLISDVFAFDKKEENSKLLNHVSIDRFTGGAIDGALFTGETIYGKGNEFALELLVNKSALEDKDIKKAFECTLNDICTGMLPLGGGVNRGNGIFNGELIKPENHE